MLPPLVRELANEKIVSMEDVNADSLPFSMEGITKLVDGKGRLRAGVLDNESWADLLEYLEFADPDFWDEIETSRNSGRVSAESVEERLGIT